MPIEAVNRDMYSPLQLFVANRSAEHCKILIEKGQIYLDIVYFDNHILNKKFYKRKILKLHR